MFTCLKDTTWNNLRIVNGLFFTFILLYSSQTKVEAQDFYAHRHEEQTYFSFGLGAAGYYGDLQDEIILIPLPALTAEISHRIAPAVRLKGGVSWFFLNATDRNSPNEDFQIRNLSFASNNLEMAASLEFHFFRQYSHGLRALINPFFVIGVGLVTVSPTAKYQGKRHALRPLRTEVISYSATTTTIPIGFGVRFKVNKHTTLIAEFAYRFTRSDYLDDVSSVYPDLEELPPLVKALSDRRQELGYPVAHEGSIRGNPDNNDGYYLLNLRLEGMFSKVFERR